MTTQQGETAVALAVAPDRLVRAARVALALAALLALVAIGFALWRAQTPVAKDPSVASVMTALEAKTQATPTDPATWRAFAEGLYQIGQFDTAANAYRRALALSPGDASLWSSLGETLSMGAQRLTPASRDAFARALARDPRDARARYFLAIGKDLDGDHAGAIGDWIALLKETPARAAWAEDVRRTVERVAAREKIDIAGRLPSADAPPAPPNQAQIAAMVEGLATRLKTRPEDTEGWIMLIRSRMVLGQRALAVEALRQARVADPKGSTRFEAAAREFGL